MSEGEAAAAAALTTMPRGGPHASWLDRKLQTNLLEFTDRDDVPDRLKRRVITGLDAMGERLGIHRANAELALRAVADLERPRILELGAGHGRLSQEILWLSPSATVTVSDLNEASVSDIASGPLGSHPRARTRVVDATAIDEPDDSYDLVVLAMAFHHLPPEVACRAIAEATRVARRFLVIDLERASPLRILLAPLMLALRSASMAPLSSTIPILHDGYISTLRAYSREAVVALAKAANPAMGIGFVPPPLQTGPASLAVVLSRPRTLTAQTEQKMEPQTA